ncbi:MAG TPA: selenoneine synthase SenA [bacterium]|nr:selenoneine synthase SenA [bacterium]
MTPSQASRPLQARDKWLCLSPATLTDRLQDVRRRTLELVDDLDENQWRGNPTPIANPVRWEVGHVAHFYERFLLGELGVLENTGPLIENGYALYNSFALDRDDRWEAPLPSRRGTLEYLRHVTWYVQDWLERHEPDAWETYLYLTAVQHEEMHSEALTWYRQIYGFPAPVRDTTARPKATSGRTQGPLPGDVEVAGGTYLCGAKPDQPYVWDNEKWAYPVELAPFRMARAPVTQAEFAEFVEADGYKREELWSYRGWRWRQRAEATLPLYWHRDGVRWLRRHYDRWVPLEPHVPMVHVNWFEAEAWCQWAGRRLPTEAEWELAATGAEPHASGHSGPGSANRRTYPWGDATPGAAHAHLDAGSIGCVDVAAHPEGDSACGCRQMLGNVWEWTASAFYPYPGYVVDYPYRECSAPWFGNHHVLRGGSWATRSDVIRNTYRNFFQPDRRDIIAGFRTCAR